MDLIDLIQNLVDNPTEREAFQRAPEDYIVRQVAKQAPGAANGQQDQQIELARRTLLQTDQGAKLTEQGTVLTIRGGRGPDPSQVMASTEPCPDGAIPLTGIEVNFRPRAPFFVEYRKANDPDGKGYHEYQCMLLKHSCIHKRRKDHRIRVYLHLCFVDPHDTHDQPQVVEIKTSGATPALFKKKSAYHLSNTVVNIRISDRNYILLRGDTDFTVTLGQSGSANDGTLRDSYYLPRSNANSDVDDSELYLVFDKVEDRVE